MQPYMANLMNNNRKHMFTAIYKYTVITLPVCFSSLKSAVMPLHVYLCIGIKDLKDQAHQTNNLGDREREGACRLDKVEKVGNTIAR